MSALQRHWFEVLRETERAIEAKQAEMDALLAQKIEAQRNFRDASLWDLMLGNLSQPRLNLKDLTWDEVETHIQNPVYGITAQNWSGDDVWLVHFYKGTKRNPHKLHIGAATRVDWQYKEIIKK